MKIQLKKIQANNIPQKLLLNTKKYYRVGLYGMQAVQSYTLN